MQRHSVDRQVREISADAALLAGRSQAVRVDRGVLVAEGEVLVHVVADRLHATVTRWRVPNSDQASGDSRSVSQ